MPARIITDGDVGGGHGAEVHKGGRLVPGETLKADPMPRVWSGSHRGFHDGTPPPHIWNGARNQLDPAVGHSDGAPTPGIRCDPPAVDKAMTLPLPCLAGVLPHMEFLALALQPEAMGGYDQDPGGSPQPPPQVQAMQEPSPVGEAKHLPLRDVEI